MIAAPPTIAALPAPVLQRFGDLTVVRDDLLPGGTKVRALLPVMAAHPGEYVFASPAIGYAQVALAVAGRASGCPITLFLARRSTMHARTLEAQALGARVRLLRPGYLSQTQARARAYAAARGATLLNLGVDHPQVRASMVRAIRAMRPALDALPTELWSVAGSGMLTLALQEAFPEVTRVFAVQIGKNLLAGGEAARRRAVGRARLLVAPERFEEEARLLPPFPSCSNYDAKAWQFITRTARPGALFWNVAA